MFSKSWIVLFFLFENFIYIHGWGPIGHSIIVSLAQTQLTGSALEWIRSLTPWHWNGNLSAMASWADDILYDNSNPTGYGNWQWSRVLHYINTPDWNCSYQWERDCINDACVAGAIKNYTKQLETEIDEIKLKEALYFLIHYVGDLHQPLHTGFTTDRGGNSIRGHYMNQRTITNLHSLWDQGLIRTRVIGDFHSNNSLYYEHIYELMQNQTVIADDNSTMEQWIEENIHYVCSVLYFDELNVTMNATKNFTLGEIYYQKSIPIIEQRLAQGGRRLGALLNQIVKNRSPTVSNGKNKLCPSPTVLIAILSLKVVLAIIFGII